jgi:hypothetical protein
VHCVTAVDPATLEVPLAHRVQFTVPVVPDHRPTGQLTHAPPLHEYLPAVQLVQLVLAAAPAVLDRPAGHARHAVAFTGRLA